MERITFPIRTVHDRLWRRFTEQLAVRLELDRDIEFVGRIAENVITGLRRLADYFLRLLLIQTAIDCNTVKTKDCSQIAGRWQKNRTQKNIRRSAAALGLSIAVRNGRVTKIGSPFQLI